MKFEGETAARMLLGYSRKTKDTEIVFLHHVHILRDFINYEWMCFCTINIKRVRYYFTLNLNNHEYSDF